jgi:LEA14-like dessication related protein
MGTGIWIALGAGLAWIVGRRKEKLSQIEFNLGTPSIQKIKSGNIQILLPLGYVNPSNESATVQSIFLSLRRDGSNIGTIQRDTPFTLEAKANKTVQVPTTITLRGAALTLLSALVNPSLNLSASGYIRTGGIEVPVRREFTLNLRGYLSELIAQLKRKK